MTRLQDCQTRSPATIARMIRCPDSPTTSEMTFASWMFIWASAFCMCCAQRAWPLSSISRWRDRLRSSHTASQGRNEPCSKP